MFGRERGGGRGRGNRGGRRGGEEYKRNRENDNSFGFPIIYGDTNATTKNISPSILPNFHGLKSEGPETFLFEFEIFCRYYDYLQNSQKLKLFPTTLKGEALKWFIALVT